MTEAELITCVKSFADLDPDWDTILAPKTIKLALDFIEQLPSCADVEVYPTFEGGIQFERGNVEIEFTTDDTIEHCGPVSLAVAAALLGHGRLT